MNTRARVRTEAPRMSVKGTNRSKKKLTNRRKAEPQIELGFVPDKINMTLAIMGGVFAFIAVFFPAISVPSIGNVTFFRIGGKFAYAIMGLGVLSFGFTALSYYLSPKFYRVNILLGAIIIIDIAIYIGFMIVRMNKSDVEASGLFGMITKDISFQWGWLGLLVSGALLMLSGLVNNKKPIVETVEPGEEFY